ncbi:hypothetical protein ALO_12451 [Acetonema longum DSM 6540]|uniref:Uncharacterized protein n=1 Tax=Acetonema longum DSM 6540 TaxID=1009370 RepID=F7NK77_9FIRM|nr:hypothetical protein ALO_12451 [Acetonema longum DSM 6540]
MLPGENHRKTIATNRRKADIIKVWMNRKSTMLLPSFHTMPWASTPGQKTKATQNKSGWLYYLHEEVKAMWIKLNQQNIAKSVGTDVCRGR